MKHWIRGLIVATLFIANTSFAWDWSNSTEAEDGVRWEKAYGLKMPDVDSTSANTSASGQMNLVYDLTLDGVYVSKDGGAYEELAGGGGGAANAAGSNQMVQYNDGGTNFGAEAGFAYNKTTDTFTAVNATFTTVNAGKIGNVTAGDATFTTIENPKFNSATGMNFRAGENISMEAVFGSINMRGDGNGVFFTNRDSSGNFISANATNKSLNHMGFFLTSNIGRAFLIGDYGSRLMNFDHGSHDNPTLYVHSSTEPDTNNTQWLGLTHNQVSGVISTGAGAIALMPAANVGIGTTAPVSNLDVYGNDAKITIRDDTSDGGDIALDFSCQSVVKTAIFSDNNGFWKQSDLRFINNGDNNSTDYTTSDTRMLIEPNGNIGIGIDEPRHLLHVAGTLTATDATFETIGKTIAGDATFTQVHLSDLSGFRDNGDAGDLEFTEDAGGTWTDVGSGSGGGGGSVFDYDASGDIQVLANPAADDYWDVDASDDIMLVAP